MNHIASRLIFTICIVALLFNALFISASNRDSSKVHGTYDSNKLIPTNPKLKEGQLPNGLHYLIFQNKKPEHKVELRLAVNAGSILEDQDQQGLAHFMEHMNFNGLKHFPHNEVVHYLQSIGVSFGADLNAYTGFDETVYILPVPSDNKNKLDSAFTILADWSGNALLDGKEIDSERGVVLEESRLGKGADDRMFKKWFPSLVNGSAYASRFPIGKDSILKTFTYDKIKRFYADWYRPDLECVIVVGDIDPSEAEKLIKDKFSAFANPTNERSRPQLIPMPNRTHSDAMEVTDPEASYTMVQLVGKFNRKIEDKTEGEFRTAIIRHLFDQLLNNRLDELRSATQPPFIGAGASQDGGFFRGWQGFVASAACGSDNVTTAVLALVQEINRAKAYGFTPAEFERSKASYLSSVEKMYNERDKTESSNYTDELIRHFFTSELVAGIDWEYKFLAGIMPTITLAEVNAVGDKIDLANNYFALVTSKPSPNLPSNAQLKTFVDSAFALKSVPYAEKSLPSVLLEKEPIKGKITKEVKNKKLQTTTYFLSNGATVTTKSTDFKDDEILLQARRFGGSALYKGSDYISADYSNNVVDEMGYGKFSNSDLKKFLQGKELDVNIGVGKYSENINGSSTKKDLKTLFQLLYLKCAEPRLSEEGYKSFISKEKQQGESQRLQPQSLFLDSALYLIKGMNPRARFLKTAAELEQINAEHSLEFYKQRFHSAYAMHYFFVGSFNESDIKPLIEQYIGALSGDKIDTTVNNLKIDQIDGQHQFVMHKGKEQKSLLYNVATAPMPYDVNNENLAALLSDILNNEIIDTLREKMGDIYGGGLGIDCNKIPEEKFTLYSYFPCGPENVHKLDSAFFKMIETAKFPGAITPVALKKVTETALQKYKVNIKTNQFWISMFTNYSAIGVNPERIVSYESRIKAITPEMLTKAANQFLKLDNLYKAVLLPDETK